MRLKNRNVSLNDKAPDFQLKSVSGDLISLSQFNKKKNVVIVFLRGFL